MTFDEFRSDLITQYESGEFAAGIALIEAHSAEFPTQAQHIAYFHASLASKLGQTEQALDVLESAVEADHWFSPTMLQQDADLAPLRDSARFAQIIAASEARMMDALGDSDPSSIVFEPTPLPDGPLPVIFALHGNGGSAKGAAELWDALAESGWLVVLPQSSQFDGATEQYIWNDGSIAREEMVAQFERISAEYTLDPSRILFAGYSRGGLRALELALSGDVPATGYVGICPSLDHFAAIEAAPAASPRLHITCGDRDRHLEATQSVMGSLEAHGLTVQLDVFEGGHQYPADMSERLNQVIAFVTS